MDYFYKLKKQDRLLPFGREVQIYEKHEGYFFFQDGTLSLYSKDNLTLVLEKNIDVDEIYFFDDFIAGRSESDIFQYDRKDLSLISLTEDYPGEILEGTRKSIKIGRIFNDDQIGLLVCDDKFKFYEIKNGDFIQKELPKYAAKVLDSNGCGSEIMVQNLLVNSSDHVIVKGKNTINLLSFKDENIIEFKLDQNVKDERVHFANLSGGHMKDMVFFTNDGILVYTYNGTKNNYDLAFRYRSFSSYRKFTDFVKFVDIDLDGVDEMVANSPWGLTIHAHNKYKKKMTNILEVVPLPSRYDMLIHATRKFVFTESGKCLNVFEIEKCKIEKKKELEITNTDIPRRSERPKIKTFVEKEELLLQNTLDHSEVFTSVGASGKVKFTLPLFTLEKSFDFVLDYDGTNAQSDVLGVGWFLKEDKIIRLHGSSIYREDEKYFLVFKNIALPITIENSTFLLDSPNFKLTHFPEKERFELDVDEMKLIYGKVDNKTDGLEFELKWREWYGPGGASDGQVTFPKAWCLKRLIIQSHVINLNYKKVDIPTPNGMSYTRAMYLSEVYDHVNKVQFFYNEKSHEEYEIRPITDEETGNYNMDTVKTRYLSGYRLEMANYVQNVVFKYNLIRGKRFLKSITQKGVDVMNFSYEDDVLRRVNFPRTNVSLDYMYELKNEDTKYIKQIETVNYLNYRVDYVNSWIIASYNSGNKTVIQINDDEMNELEKFTINNNNKLVSIFNTKPMLCAVFVSGEIVILHQEKKKFYEKGILQFPEETIFTPSGSFVMYRGKTVGVIEHDKETDLYVKKDLFVENGLVATSFNRFVAVYDNINIRLAYKTADRWCTKVLKSLPGYIDHLNNTLNLFDFSEHFKNDMYTMFSDVLLQIFNNMLMINTIKYENLQFETILNVFILNQSYDIVKEKEITVTQDDVTSLVKDTHLFKTIYEVVYEPSDGKLKKKVIGFKGELKQKLDEAELFKLNEIKNIERQKRKQVEIFRSEQEAIIMEKAEPYYKKAGKTYKYLVDEKVSTEHNTLNAMLDKELEHLLKNLEKARQDTIDEFEKVRIEICQNVSQSLPRDYSLLDRDRYSFYLLNGKIANNKIQYIYNGQHFIENQMTTPLGNDIRLGDGYRLQKDGTFKLIKDTDEIDLGVSELQDVQNGFPFYTASITSNGLKVVQFHKYTKPEVSEIAEGLFAHGFTGLATIDNSTVSVRHETLHYAFPDRRVKRIQLSLNNGKIVTGFDYKFPKFANELYYQVHSVIPGDDLKKYGRVEFHNGTKKFFNADEILVKTINKIERKGKVETNEKELLFDKTGLFVISDFTPYKTKDDEVCYYGFETYEENKKFTFDSDYVATGFALTGKNYLMVKSGLQGTFEPKYQSGVYKVSCWLRSAQRLTIGEKTVLVKMTVEKDGVIIFGVLGEILFEMRDWVYVEAVVDLSLVREISNDVLDFTDELSITVKISNCDLDHVLFAPNILKTSVNVFNEEGNVSEVIVNGLIKRQIYKMNRKVASVDEYGNLELYVSRGKNSILQIRPATGYYETFSLFSFGTSLIADIDTWAVSPGVLRHEGKESVMKITTESHCMAFDYSLKRNAEIVIGDLIINETSITFQGESKVSDTKGEVTLARINHTCFVWLDGSIIFQKTAVFDLDMKFKGEAYIKNLFVFDNPSVKMVYLNGIEDKMQEITLIDEKTALVEEFLYDELGRQVIQTRPIVLSGNIFEYHQHFVINKNPDDEDYVGKIGRIKGEAGEYSYTRIEYEGCPLNRIRTYDRDPSVKSDIDSFFKRYRYNGSYPLLRNVFPADFYFVTEEKQGGVEKTKVYDPSDTWRGTYIKVSNGKGLLSTFEYNGTNLVRILPPLYHEKAGTLRKFNSRETEKEKILKRFIGVHYEYDEKDRLVETTSPDSGKTMYIYENDFLKFVIYEDTVIFFDYEGDWLSKIGVLKSKNLNSEKIVYQSFVPAEHKNPAIKGSVFRTITYDKLTAIEEIVESKKMHTKRIILPDGLTMELKKKIYNLYKVEIEYPAFVNNERFKIFYKYNRLGQLTNVYSNDGLVDIVYKYNGLRLAQENKGENFQRFYMYNSAGFLTNITDEFLTEEISYRLGSYGGISFGEGTIVRTTFKAHWHDFAQPDNTDCYEKLKERNYLDDKGHLIKDFYPYLELDMVNCTSLYENHFPSRYGHAYTYGKYQQLIKAKFFVDEVPPILQPNSFADVPGLNSTASKAIWKSLEGSGFIIADKEFLDEHLVHSKKGRPIINPLVFRELEINDFRQYKLIENVLLGSFNDEYLAYILGKKTMSVLNKKGFLKDPYSEGFKLTLKDFKDKLREITDILRKSFATELGTNQYDFDSYEIDPNGNLLKFYTGFNKFYLSYRENTNLVDNVKINEVKYNLKHDKRGNVIRAEHRDIEKLVYNQVMNCVTEIRMKCGKVIHYSYDSSGERIYKMVQQDGNKIEEIFYLRDEAKRTVVEKQIRYKEEPDVLVTLYVYGPAGLTGFVRRNKFYNVLTDHEGSVRLVVRDGEVVSAYDYLPYGELMRKNIFDPDADLAYRFTGQEYDKETGLYNFHARLYDPSLGRFYQIDPKGQYFSPYLYAGNSPVTLVDPDGEIAWFIPILGAGVVYLYNRLSDEWDMKSWKMISLKSWISGAIEGIRTIENFRDTVAILEEYGVRKIVAIPVILGVAGIMTAIKFTKSNSKFHITSLTTWVTILNMFFKSINEIHSFVKVTSLPKDVNKPTLGREKEKQHIDTGDNPVDEKTQHSWLRNAKKLNRKQRLTGPKKRTKKRTKNRSSNRNFKKLFKTRHKRSSEEGFIDVSCKNITVISSKEDDSIMYFSKSQVSTDELNLLLEECLGILDKVITEMDAVIVKQIKSTLNEVIINKARHFESTEFKGFIIDDERYRAYVAMAVEILDTIPKDTEVLKNIKENAAVFLKEIWNDYDLMERAGKIRNLPADPIKWKIDSDDNLAVTAYKEPCDYVKCHLAEIDWACDDDVPAWDPAFPEVNSTLLLIDVLHAKKRKRTLQRSKRQTSMGWSETMAHTLNIVDSFENFLNEISGEEISLYQMVDEIRSKLSKSRFDEITPLLDNYVKNSSIDFHVYQREKHNLERRMHEILFQNETNVFSDQKTFTDHPNSAFVASKILYKNMTFKLLSHNKH